MMSVEKLKLTVFFLFCCYCTVHNLPLLMKWQWTDKEQDGRNAPSNSNEKVLLKSLRARRTTTELENEGRRRELDTDCEYVGKFPMKNYCEGFIECHLGENSKLEAFVNQCPEGTEYSINYRRCIHPQIARCTYEDDYMSTSHPQVSSPNTLFRIPESLDSERLSYRRADDDEEELSIVGKYVSKINVPKVSPDRIDKDDSNEKTDDPDPTTPLTSTQMPSPYITTTNNVILPAASESKNVLSLHHVEKSNVQPFSKQIYQKEAAKGYIPLFYKPQSVQMNYPPTPQQGILIQPYPKYYVYPNYDRYENAYEDYYSWSESEEEYSEQVFEYEYESMEGLEYPDEYYLVYD